MSLRLSGDAGGDSTRAESFLRNPLCESEIRVIPTNPRNIHLHPNSSTSDFFPQSFREKLKIIILNSSDPKRSLGYLRARFAEFSRTRPSKGCAARSAEKAQITPALDGAISGVLIHGGRKSSDGPGAEAQVTLPLDVSDAPLGTPPQVTGLLIQGERESSDEPDAESRAISSPEVIAPFHSRFPFDSPPVDSVNPMLEQEDTQLEKAVDRGMKSQSMLPNSQRFYAGSNHRIKKRQKIAINQDSPKSSTLPLLFQFLSLLSHRCPSPVHKAGEAAKLMMENSSVQAGGGSSNSNAAPNKMRMIGVDGREGQGATTTQASPFQRLKGKMAMMETATEKEKKILVWNISKNKPISRIRLMAVGVYLSIMAITSKTLLDGMKRIWQIRGHIDTMQLPDRRFVIEFSELGDFEHVVKGGPWNFRNDVVLIEELKEGIDAESFTFSTIPIWVQFQKIPFYLLSQQLVKDLGNEVGELVTFDKYARGDICDKILRARVRIPIDQALQRWVTFRDEYEQQNVTTCLAYERLPNFCCSCGIIGHLVTECRAPDKEKMVLYDVGIGAPPTLPEDPRRWPIPEFTGQARQLHTFPWRSNRGRDGWLTRTGNRQQLPTIAQVAKDVGKLTVNDPQESNAKEAAPTLTNTSPTTLASSPLRQEITIANTNKDGEAAPPVGDAVLEKLPPLQDEIAKNVSHRTLELSCHRLENDGKENLPSIFTAFDLQGTSVSLIFLRDVHVTEKGGICRHA
jgi:hypothetical protein